MAHRPGHGGSSTQARRVEQTRREQSIADRRRAAQSMQRAGLTSLGDPGLDARRQESIKRGYVPPQEGGGGRITETRAGPRGTTTKTVTDLPPEDTTTTTTTSTGGDTTTDDDKKQVTTFDIATQTAIKQNLPLLSKVLGATARIDANGNIIFVDRLGSTIPQFKVLDALSKSLDNLTGFKPDKAFDPGGMGDTGKAALFDKISNMDQIEFEDFLNRKGNLDRILEYGKQLDDVGERKLLELVKNKDAKSFANIIARSGGENFEDELLKKTNPTKYYAKYPPQTQGALAEAAAAGVSYIPGFGPVTPPSESGLPPGQGAEMQFAGGAGAGAGAGGGGAGGGTTTNPGDLIFRTMYRPNFTPSYTGGPEQIQLAGGFFDPVTKQVVFDPYGTANQYRFSKGGIANFKNYGY
jgi:hypothetical protein